MTDLYNQNSAAALCIAALRFCCLPVFWINAVQGASGRTSQQIRLSQGKTRCDFALAVFPRAIDAST
ncbi:hypothetical protein HYDPIDRAFT_117425 [Hydnomerulius pinastri MD-312]|uniref:Uncharacterized protein n=1 Tax=Hydnomerulius pinastri MD-312 TaxID=994086 RepID=A0A0C9VR15_9AGAM|nr:hypothetical protein HYDPIDRAFT_117425 [Hydnomerulius pinastri MD-312]